jgi:hypothetical protein
VSLGAADPLKEQLMKKKKKKPYIPYDEPFMQDDRLWFQLHRDRQYRIRLTDPGEVTVYKIPDGAEQYTFVQQLGPGLRTRQFLALKNIPNKPCDELWASDAQILDFLSYIGMTGLKGL